MSVIEAWPESPWKEAMLTAARTSLDRELRYERESGRITERAADAA
jgi:hypothetical protein